MKIQPNNQYLLLEPCDNPFKPKDGELLVGNTMSYAKIVRSAATDDYAHLKEVGAIVFFIPATAEGQHCFAFPIREGQTTYLLMLMGYVLGYIPAEEAKDVKTITMKEAAEREAAEERARGNDNRIAVPNKKILTP